MSDTEQLVRRLKTTLWMETTERELAREAATALTALEKALRELLVAVTFAEPREFGPPGDRFMGYEAKMPMDFVTNAGRALGDLRPAVRSTKMPTARKTEFHFRVNGREEMVVELATGTYVSAVAAIPAHFGIEDYPLNIEIWAPSVMPEYGPYHYSIEEPGAKVLSDLTECSREHING